MTDKDLTDWFPGHVKPVRHGVYQRKYDDDGDSYCMFDGVWRMWSYSPEGAVMAKQISALQCLEWRGLRKP